MKQSTLNPINPERLYEVTEVLPGDAYVAEKLIGTIIEPRDSLRVERTALRHGNSRPCYRGSAIVIHCPTKLYRGNVTFYAVMLRPLTMKEQANINKSNHGAGDV